MKLNLKEKISLATKVLLVALISLSVIQLNQIKDIHATTLLPEATTRVSVLASGANIEELGASDIHKISIGGTDGFCLDPGKALRSGDDFARTTSNVSGEVAQVVNWFKGEKSNMDEEQCRGIATAIIWAIQKGKTSNDQLASIIEDVIIYYTSSGATGFGDLFRDWYYYGDANHTGIKNYPTTGSYKVWSYGSNNRQRIVATTNTPPDITYPEIIPARVSSTKSYKTTESIRVKINKIDIESVNKLSGVAFDFYQDGIKGGSATTDNNGLAEHTFTTEFTKSATATKEYCSNFDDLSLENQALITGYTSKAEAQADADKEALDKAKELAEAGSGQEHTYKVVETSTKTNYWLNPATSTYEKKFTGSGVVEFNISNTRQKGSITITKRDSETNNLVDNAVYGLYARSSIVHPDGTTGTLFVKDQLVASFPGTAVNGTSKLSGLYLGQYYVKEITAPPGYLHSTDVYNVDLNYAGQNVEITDASATVKDRVQRAKVEFIKKDKELADGTKDPTIFDFNGDKAQGDATIIGATYGLYAREDIIHADGTTGVVSYNNITDSIHQLKLTKGTNLEVKNVQAKAGTLLATAKTDANHQIGFEHLYNGKYYLKEIDPSTGYVKDETEYDVNLSYSNQNEIIVSKNTTVYETVKKQAFDLYKAGHVPGTSTNAKPLPNVEFTVWLENDIQSFVKQGKTLAEAKNLAPIYDKLITKADGTASSIELPYGHYRAAETKAAIDYATARDFFVTVSEDSRTHQSFTNNVIIDEKFKGLIEAIKLDFETAKQVKLEGAEFRIKNTDTGEYFGYWQWLPFPHYVDSWTTNSEGYVRLQEELEAGNYQLEEIHAPEGYVLDTTPVTFKITNQDMYELAEDGKTPIIRTYKSDVSVKGKIIIEKQGEVLTDYKDNQFIYELKGLKDAEYNIYAENPILDPSNDGSVLFEKDELVTSVKTDESGKATSKELPLGDYYSKEKTAPPGYSISDEVKNFKLKYEDETVAIVYDQDTYINDRQKVSVEASKQDAETKTYLPDAEITLKANRDVYNFDGEIIVSEGTILETVITGIDGKAKFNTDLPNDLCPEYAVMPIDEFDDVDPGFSNNVVNGVKLVGDPNSLFMASETKAPSGYIPFAVNYYIDTKYTNQNEAVLKFETAFFNDQTVTHFDKKDASTDKSINTDGEYQIIDPVTNKVVSEWVGDGKIHTEKGLTFEKEYIWREIEAPKGYELAKDIRFTVKRNQTLIMKDNPLLNIEKLDKVNNFIIPGNDLELLDAETREVIKKITTTDKALTFSDLITDHEYILKETKQAEGYYLNTEEVRFTFVPGVTVKFYNDPIMTDLQANKIDSVTKKPVLSADFEFTLYSDPECKNIIDVVNANVTNGTATFKDVRYGTWYIKETKAPIGYKLSNEVKKIVINDNLDGVGNLYSFIYENTLLPVVIIKTNDSTAIISFVILALGASVGIMLSRKKRKGIIVNNSKI